MAAVLLCKDEDDVIEWTCRHLVEQVDEVLVWDNLSTDDTRPILDALVAEGLPLKVFDDTEVGYMQSVKTTHGAMVAMERGHQWVLPVDADERTSTTDERPIREFLNGLAPDVRVVTSELFNHIPTALDVQDEPNPFRRITWRKRERAPLGKVCVRLHPELIIHQGNHGVWLPGQTLAVPGLVTRHYSWRSPEQYYRKLVNGAAAYGATTLPENIGLHWRMFGNPPDEATVKAHFTEWFWSADPWADSSLIFDPSPIE